MLIAALDAVLFQRLLAPWRGTDGVIGRLVLKWDVWMLRRRF